MIEVLAMRHGNTFGPGDPVLWVGRNEDLPLVDAGHQQAQVLGQSLAAIEWVPDLVFASALQRTQQHARGALAVLADSAGVRPALRAQAAGLDVVADPRLDEIDYGPWGGLGSAEIEARGDGAALSGWSERGHWPPAFAETREQVAARVQSLLDSLVESGSDGVTRVLLVSSNGVLRFALAGCPEAQVADLPTVKVRTGHGGILRCVAGQWSVEAWNQPPDALADALARSSGGSRG